jgi:hypothetical protein
MFHCASQDYLAFNNPSKGQVLLIDEYSEFHILVMQKRTHLNARREGLQDCEFVTKLLLHVRNEPCTASSSRIASCQGHPGPGQDPFGPDTLPLPSADCLLDMTPIITDLTSYATMTDKRIYLENYRKDYKSRIKRVSITLTVDEYKRFVRIADRDKQSVTTLVTGYALAALNRTDINPEPIARELAELKFLISNIANNVNQMARHSNTVLAFVEEGALLAELERLQHAIETHTSNAVRAGHDH